MILAAAILISPIAIAQTTSAAQQPQKSTQQGTPTPSPGTPDIQTNSAPFVPGQQGPPPAAETDKNAPEITTEESEATFRVQVNLIEVRVVVRDAQGHPVSGLKKQDFQLLDDGKPQIITRFSAEESGAQPAIHRQGEVAEAPETRPSSGISPAAGISPVPQHYVAYLFDDVHLPFSALATARIAAVHHLQSLPATDRAAIYTTSGQTQMDFTDDRDALRDTLYRLMPRPIGSSLKAECPHMTHYMADMIENRGDTQALDAATFDAIECAFQGETRYGAAAESMARDAARNQLHAGDYDGRIALEALRRVVQRIAIMPGQRTILFVSPGFLNINQHQEQLRVVERALHSGIVINTLDARGLYTAGDDASIKLPPRHPLLRWKDVDANTVDGMYRHYAELAKSAQADVLMGLAEDTGGTFFHNSNNLLAGFEAGSPAYTYLLGFSPPNLKLDGSFHTLKVKIQGQKYDIQARNGYFAPKKAINAAEQARRDVEEAVFSQEQWRDIPVQLHTEFFKLSEQDATLSVLVRLDARPLHFHKVDGRNRNDVTVISALFDHNGRFINGTEKVLEMRLKDETLGSKLISGLTVRTSFDVKPGSYLVRLVVCDDNGRMAAQSDAVEIP
ncbi:MAG: VWA domain-containing protein [Terriglobales bacterium]